MGLAPFLSALFADGRVHVAAGDPVPSKTKPTELEPADGLPAEGDRVDAELLAFERDRRDDLPATPPAVELAAARYGAVMLYRACQFLVFRDVDPETIQRELSRSIDGSVTPLTHYSVDLTLRYLPDVVRLACGESKEDPLVTELTRLAGQWPLSAVGISGAEVGDVTAIVSDPCLLRLYVDRIIARQDLGRLGNEQVRAAAAQAIGAFPQLAPAVSAALGMPGNQRENLQEETE